MTKTKFAIAAAFATGLVAAPASASAADAAPKSADEKRSPFSAELAAGAEYDSNVSVSDLDNNTGADDVAAVIDADFEFSPDVGEKTEFDLGYSFSQSLYAEFDAFNLQSHLATADFSREVGGFDIGGAYRFSHARLGGDPFLTMHQIAPYVSRFIGDRVFLRAEYAYTDRNFIGRTDRDGRSHAGSGDIYVFLRGSKTYVSAGYKYENEDTTDPQFAFTGHNFRARISHKVPLGRRFAQLKLGYRFEDRGYDAITPSIAAVRADTRHRIQAEVEIPIGDTFFARFEFEHADYQSNLPSADFRQNVGSAKLGARF
jgi:hypothetical protein